jgi:hypothetical protein
MFVLSYRVAVRGCCSPFRFRLRDTGDLRMNFFSGVSGFLAAYSLISFVFANITLSMRKLIRDKFLIVKRIASPGKCIK